MTPLIAGLVRHHAAFAAETHGALGRAQEEFATALSTLAGALADATVLDELRARASRYPPGFGTPEGVAQTFARCLPDWLIDVHLARCARALSARELSVARMHWEILLGAEGFAARSYRRALADCRSWIESRFFRALSEAPTARIEQLELAERVLLVDPGHDGIRARLVAAYVTSVYEALDLAEEPDKLWGAKLPRPPRRRVRTAGPGRLRVPKYARRLRRHATRLARRELDAEARKRLADTFRVLAAYWRQEADEDLAARMQRWIRRMAGTYSGPAPELRAALERPPDGPPPVLDTNPFAADGDPYVGNPLTRLGVSATDDDVKIRMRVRQAARAPGSWELDPLVAERRLADRVLRLAYDLMQSAEEAMEPGVRI